MSLIFTKKPTILTIKSLDGENLYYDLDKLIEKCDFLESRIEKNYICDMPFTSVEINNFLIYVSSHNDDITLYKNIEKIYNNDIKQLKEYLNDIYFEDLNEQIYDEIIVFTRFICKFCIDIAKICNYVMYDNVDINEFLDKMWRIYYLDKPTIVHKLNKCECKTFKWDNTEKILNEIYENMLKYDRYCLDIFIKSFKKDIDRPYDNYTWWKHK